jgi:hypothetical protein
MLVEKNVAVVFGDYFGEWKKANGTPDDVRLLGISEENNSYEEKSGDKPEDPVSFHMATVRDYYLDLSEEFSAYLSAAADECAIVASLVKTIIGIDPSAEDTAVFLTVNGVPLKTDKNDFSGRLTLDMPQFKNTPSYAAASEFSFEMLKQDAEIVDLGCHVTGIAVRDAAIIGPNTVFHTNNDFIMTLNSDKHTYDSTDIIKIWGTLEYVGDDDAITIYSSCPFMLFSIAGGDFGSGMGASAADVLVTSVLERGRVYHFEYQKSGGWSADDPNAENWERFFSESDLLLPAGEYTFTLSGGFSMSDRIIGSESKLLCDLRIVINE